jgi:hypothetical protein
MVEVFSLNMPWNLTKNYVIHVDFFKFVFEIKDIFDDASTLVPQIEEWFNHVNRWHLFLDTLILWQQESIEPHPSSPKYKQIGVGINYWKYNAKKTIKDIG